MVVSEHALYVKDFEINFRVCSPFYAVAGRCVVS